MAARASVDLGSARLGGSDGIPEVAVVHDYLTQRGGAERVVLSLLDALPGARLHTSLYDPERTFPEFGDYEVRTSRLNDVRALRRHHRLALPALAPAFSRMVVGADVAVCSSSGWAHGAVTTGRKLVYCHNPARWLYQSHDYVDGSRSRRSQELAIRLAGGPLRRWDHRAAVGADRYLANSTVVQERIARTYGIDADVVHPPVSVDVAGPRREVEGCSPGYVLVVGRLMPYKNVGSIVAAAERISRQVVVAGSGPLEAAFRAVAPPNVTFTGQVDDEQLRWLYAHAACLVAASLEDFGLTPIEANAFGVPVAALRANGFLDTVIDGQTGRFFDRPRATEIARAVEEVLEVRWDRDAIRSHAARFSKAAFGEHIRAAVRVLAAA